MDDAADAALRDWTVDLARRAGETLLGYFCREDLASRLKADYSLVTEADLAADALIAGAILAEHPADAILSEEDNTRHEAENEYVWIIDPIDGTTNFSHGLQYWGVSIARIRAGHPSLAVLFFPALDEMYVATRAGGAFCNGKRIVVEPPPAPGRWRVMACCSRTMRFYDVNVPMKMRVFGCATYSMVSVARGSAAVAVETRPKIWDLAAASLMVEEAGGVVAYSPGPVPFPLQTGVAYDVQSYPLIAAATADLAEMAREGIQERNSR
ncbi:MAG TPA: inositol monophosphatase family protein [Candidatus Binatia bacterium]|nr:inositol monophosphatase family protein [Candidatus Binatia bacterium]